ncbi:MAG: hypothetical protein ACKUBY_02430 [Candidatus Moraniibacteriota bacterium]|jgi:hypothetical protein
MEVILMENLILILDDGFEITSYSKKYLSKIGALLFLHYNDYLTQKNIINCIKDRPQDIQNEVTISISRYESILLNFNSLKDINTDLHIFISRFPADNSQSLFITISDKYKPIVKKLLSDIIFE